MGVGEEDAVVSGTGDGAGSEDVGIVAGCAAVTAVTADSLLGDTHPATASVDKIINVVFINPPVDIIIMCRAA